MSTTTIKAVWPGERAEDLEELRNSWHSAALFWDKLAQTYLGLESFMFEGKKVWALINDPRLSVAEKAVLNMTFDRAYVLRKDYVYAGKHIREAMTTLSFDGHWPRIAEIFESDPDVPAIGFHWTSVGEDLFQPDWTEDDDGNEVEVPVDWTEFWSVYDHTD